MTLFGYTPRAFAGARRALVHVGQVLFVLGWVVLAASPAYAQPGDELDAYGVNDADWTGLRDFAELARAEGVELGASNVLDLGALDPAEPLVIFYPQQPLDVESLAGFVIDGGRIVLADDFGHSDAFLQRLSIARRAVSPMNLPHQAFVGGNPAFPLFEPRGRHPLLEEVDRLVANHPAVLFNVGGPVVAFDESGGLVYDMTLGEGKVIVIADPSMFINHMLGVADNAALARNALHYACREQRPCRAQLLSGTWQERGHYHQQSGERRHLEQDLRAQIDELNAKMRSIIEGLPVGDLLYYLSLLLVGGLAAYLATIFPLRRPRAYSRYIQDCLASAPAPQSEFDWNMERFGKSEEGRVNYALPLAILKEVFEEMFLSAMGLWPSRSHERPNVEALGRAFVERYLPDASAAERRRVEREVVDVLATFAGIPTRHRVFLDSDAYFGERDLIRIYRRAMELLRIMGLEEEYERRTRSLA